MVVQNLKIMKAKRLIWNVACLCAAITIFSSCSKDDTGEENNLQKGEFRVLMTDSPIDDASVEGAFVSFTAVKLDGKTYNLSGTKTIEVSALTRGKTETLFENDVEIGSYNSLELVLDYAKDENGNQPGCYVLTNDGMKHDLMLNTNQSNTLRLNLQDTEVSRDEKAELVVDFDLRKAIRYDADNSKMDKYNFSSNLNSSLRATGKNTVKIEGRIIDENQLADDKIVVYAYAKGSFNENAETRLDSNTDIMFESAVSSCLVDKDGTFALHFMNKGEYDLKIVSYHVNDNGRTEAKAFLETGFLADIGLLGLNINSNTFLNLTIASKKQI